jgi:hypothetical protein
LTGTEDPRKAAPPAGTEEKQVTSIPFDFGQEVKQVMCDKQSKGRASRVLSRSDSDVICTQLSKGMKRRPKTQAQQRGAKSWSMHAPGGLPGEAERKRFLSMITRTGRSIWSIDRTPLSWLKNSSSSWHMPATPPCLLLLLCSKSKAKERESQTPMLSLSSLVPYLYLYSLVA